MKRSFLLKRLAAVVLSLVLHGVASASTLVWYSDFGSVLLDSNGQELDNTYSFEIGTFGMGFTPTAANAGDWAANWKILDRAFQDDANGWNWEFRFYTGNVEHNSDGKSESSYADPLQVFVQGEAVYLWVYNSKDILPGSEWALVGDAVPTVNTDQWIIPDPLDPLGTSYEFNLNDADNPVIGGVNNVRGAGEFTATPATFSLQTASVVPEPGSALLLFAAGAAFLARRTSRRLTRSTLA